MSANKSALLLVLGCSIAAASLAHNQVWFEVRGGDWQTSPEIASELRTKFEPAIAELAGEKYKHFRPWGEYKFQFQGRHSHSRRYIFISALCSAYDMRDLTKEFVVVLDGGACFFEVKYDPQSQRFYDLTVHGEG
jgi:hypothetical protein